MLIPFAASLSVNCVFKTATWANFEPAYFCYLKGVKAETPDTTVTEGHGNHLSGKTETDVNSIWIDQSPDCLYFPKGLESFFRNIKGLSVTSSGLKSITQDDLRVFPKLTAFWVYSNKLTTVEPKLFTFNPKLKIIDFGNNRIRSISADLFDPFENIEKALFNKNICTITDAKTPDELKALEKEILEKCQNGLPIENSQLTSDGCQCKSMVDEISFLRTMFLKQQKEIDRLRSEFDGLTTFSQ